MHSPQVAASLYRPLLAMREVDPFPSRLVTGSRVRAELRVFGVIPIGRQLINITDLGEEPVFGRTDVRTMRDHGRPLSGPLGLLATWNHEMTVWPRAGFDNQCVWNDELSVSGRWAPLFAIVLRVTWLARARKLRVIATQWR